jgi:outer membrane protein OmpA-like peptidoglycan-associated protein
MTAPSAPPPATSVEEVYRRRLAEFNTGSVPAAAPVTDSVKPAVSVATAADVNPGTVLISPSEYRRKLSHDNGGARPLEAFDASHSAASFEVASLRFGEGTAELSAGELQRLKDVAALYREKPGLIRVLGRSASPRLEMDVKANQTANRQLAGARAAAIARELVKLGVPAHKIFAGAVLSTAQVSASSGETTEIYIDY